MSENEWVTVYDLHRDKRWVQEVRNASRQREEVGLAAEPALFGSREWWALVGADRLPVHVIDGVISRVFRSGQNDFPEVEVDDGAARTTLMRRGEDSAYQSGRRIRIRYVEIGFQRRVRGAGATSKDILSIEIGPAKSTDTEASPAGGAPETPQDG